MTEAEKIKAQIAELQQKLEAIEAGYWVPQIGHKYYWITSDGDVSSYTWSGYDTDKSRLEMGKVFRTYKEAEHNAKVRRAYVKFSQMPGVKKFEPGTNNWTVVFDYETNLWLLDIRRQNYYIMGIYFDSEHSCLNAIKAMGDEMDLLKNV